MSAGPLVTIVTPAYNRADLLVETIESVLAQDYPRVELIVLDDGSTDHTAEVLARYAGRLRAYAHANMGESRTVNRGFSLAEGEVVSVLSSDDTLEPHAVRVAVERLEAAPELAGVYGDWALMDLAGRPCGHVTAPEFDLGRMVAGFMNFPGGPGAFFRRRVLEVVQGRDPAFRYIADFDFWLRVALTGPLARVPSTVARYRVHGAQATLAEAGLAMAAEYLRLADKLFAMPDLPAAVRELEAPARSCAYLQAATACGFSRATWLPRLRYNLLALGHCPPDDLPALLWRAALVARSALGPAVGPLDTALRRARDRLADRSPRLRRVVLRLRARDRR
ncbi:MAG: glycosyltransferase [Planctomycetes bacterium]|nr:glycosyltransferase [Planctomycetota bacterium]